MHITKLVFEKNQDDDLYYCEVELAGPKGVHAFVNQQIRQRDSMDELLGTLRFIGEAAFRHYDKDKF